MSVIEKIFAAVVVAACVLLLVRLGLGYPARARFDDAWRRAGGTVRRSSDRTIRRVRRMRLGWLERRREKATRRHAARVAAEVIRRAQQRAAGEWDGNVYRPKSLRPGRKHDELH